MPKERKSDPLEECGEFEDDALIAKQLSDIRSEIRKREKGLPRKMHNGKDRTAKGKESVRRVWRSPQNKAKLLKLYALELYWQAFGKKDVGHGREVIVRLRKGVRPTDEDL
jgi:hypothetical protein